MLIFFFTTGLGVLCGLGFTVLGDFFDLNSVFLTTPPDLVYMDKIPFTDLTFKGDVFDELYIYIEGLQPLQKELSPVFVDWWRHLRNSLEGANVEPIDVVNYYSGFQKAEYESVFLHKLSTIDLFDYLVNCKALDLEKMSISELFAIYVVGIRYHIGYCIENFEPHSLLYHFLNLDYIRMRLDSSDYQNYGSVLSDVLISLNLWSDDLEVIDRYTALGSLELVYHVLELQPYVNFEGLQRLDQLRTYVMEGKDELAFSLYRSDVAYKAYREGYYLELYNYNLRIMFEVFKSLTGSNIDLQGMNDILLNETKSIVKTNLKYGVNLDEEFFLLLYKDYIRKCMELNYKPFTRILDVNQELLNEGYGLGYCSKVKFIDSMDPLKYHQDFIYDFSHIMIKYGNFKGIPGEKQRAFLTLIEWARLYVHLNYWDYYTSMSLYRNREYIAFLNMFYEYSLQAKLFLHNDFDSWEKMRLLILQNFLSDLKPIVLGPAFFYAMDGARFNHYIDYAQLLYVYSDLNENGWTLDNIKWEVFREVINSYLNNHDYLNIFKDNLREGYLFSSTPFAWEDSEMWLYIDDNDPLRTAWRKTQLSSVFWSFTETASDLYAFIDANAEGWEEERIRYITEDVHGLRLLFSKDDKYWGSELDEFGFPIQEEIPRIHNFLENHLGYGDLVFLNTVGDELHSYYRDEEGNLTIIKDVIGRKWDATHWEIEEVNEALINFDKIRGVEHPVHLGITDDLFEELKILSEKSVGELNVGGEWLRANPMGYEVPRASYLHYDVNFNLKNVMKNIYKDVK